MRNIITSFLTLKGTMECFSVTRFNGLVLMEISNYVLFVILKLLFFSSPFLSRFSILISPENLAFHLCIRVLYLTFDICHNATRLPAPHLKFPPSYYYIVGRNLSAPWYTLLLTLITNYECWIIFFLASSAHSMGCQEKK